MPNDAILHYDNEPIPGPVPPPAPPSPKIEAEKLRELLLDIVEEYMAGVTVTTIDDGATDEQYPTAAAVLARGYMTAYQYAKQAGYTGTEEQFAELMADYAFVGEEVAAEGDTQIDRITTAGTTAVNAVQIYTTQAETAAQSAAQSAQDARLYKGSPLLAATVAEMTDEERVYVYTGSEDGYTAGNWYFYDGEAWTSGGTYNSAAVQTDATLSVSGTPADAKTTGDVIHHFADGAQDIFLKSDFVLDGHYSADKLYNGKKISSTGPTENASGHATTRILNGTYKLDAVSIKSASLCFKMAGYSSTTIGTATYLGQTDYISGMTGQVLYRPVNWPYCTLEVARVPLTDTTAFTAEELDTIAALISRYAYNGLPEQVAADGTAISANTSLINSRTTYSIDTSELQYGFGGVASNGKSNSSTARLRYRAANGAGAIKILAGSKITPAEGYQFDLALYSAYVSNSSFTLLSYSSGNTAEVTVTDDCFARIAFGTTGNDTLWETDADGNKTLTEDGETALENALTMELGGGTVKNEIEKLQMEITGESSRVYEIKSIPLNAVAYHALWDDLVTAGRVTRELLCKVDNDNDLPIYMYTLRSDMDHIGNDYIYVPWNGSNQIYSRPKIFLSGGLHGNERTPPVAILQLVNDLFTDQRFQRLRNAFDWYIVPLLNPWGFSHTAIVGGKVSSGSGFNYSEATFLDNGTIFDGAAVHQGIRRNEDAVDINRDFESFSTQEAAAARSAIASATADGVDFVYAADCHQAATGNYVNVIGSFMSLSYNATDADKNLIYGKWMQAGALTEKAMAEYADVELKQAIYPWVGSSDPTMRNYLESFSDYASCIEGGQTCVYFSGSKEYSNPTARAMMSTQLHNFLEILAEIWT